MASLKNYINSLEPDVKKRYKGKLKLMDDVDPYATSKKKWSTAVAHYPAIKYPDIINYVLFTKSAFTNDDLKNFKTLQLTFVMMGERYFFGAFLFMLGFSELPLYFSSNSVVFFVLIQEHTCQTMNLQVPYIFHVSGLKKLPSLHFFYLKVQFVYQVRSGQSIPLCSFASLYSNLPN